MEYYRHDVLLLKASIFISLCNPFQNLSERYVVPESWSSLYSHYDSAWMIHFQLHLCNCWTEFANLCFCTPCELRWALKWHLILMLFCCGWFNRVLFSSPPFLIFFHLLVKIGTKLYDIIFSQTYVTYEFSKHFIIKNGGSF